MSGGTSGPGGHLVLPQRFLLVAVVVAKAYAVGRALHLACYL